MVHQELQEDQGSLEDLDSEDPDLELEDQLMEEAWLAQLMELDQGSQPLVMLIQFPLVSKPDQELSQLQDPPLLEEHQVVSGDFDRHLKSIIEHYFVKNIS